MLAGHTLDGGRSWLAPGHASVLTDGDRQLLVHHVRDAADPTQHEVQVRRLVWTADGWPAVSPQPWAGDAEPDDPPPTDPADLAGTWELVTFDQATAGSVTTSRTMTIGDELLATVTVARRRPVRLAGLRARRVPVRRRRARRPHAVLRRARRGGQRDAGHPGGIVSAVVHETSRTAGPGA